jgi:hypothetical protein
VVVLEESQVKKVQKNHNFLNFLVEAKIEKVEIRVFLTESTSKDVIYFQIGGIQSEIFVHESKTRINLQLSNLELLDCIREYKCDALRYFLKTEHTNEH